MKPLLLALGLAAFLPALGAAQDSMPLRKPGLWETSIPIGGRSVVTALCTDEALEKRFSPLRGQQSGMTGDCKDVSAHRTATGFEMEGSCTSNGHVNHFKGKLTGDFNDAYVIDMQTERDGQAMPPMHMTARWAGPCGDKKPGDMIVAGRVVGNMSAMMAGGAR